MGRGKEWEVGNSKPPERFVSNLISAKLVFHLGERRKLSHSIQYCEELGDVRNKFNLKKQERGVQSPAINKQLKAILLQQWQLPN